MQTPLSNLPTVDITGQTLGTTQNDTDEFLTYNTSAVANRKETRATLRKSVTNFGGTGSDGLVDGTASITLTGSNGTVIEKNYTSWVAGTAPRTFTITPTRCFTYIRIKGDANFTNWTFNFSGK